MPKFRKKPVVIEAIQLTRESFTDCVKFMGDKIGEYDKPECYIEIPTLEGDMAAYRGDWIIKGIQGEFYPCKPDIFEQTYEPSEPEANAILENKVANTDSFCTAT